MKFPTVLHTAGITLAGALNDGKGARKRVPAEDAEQPLSPAKPTFTNTLGKEQDAPIPDLPAGPRNDEV
jgi:hypothetical protein